MCPVCVQAYAFCFWPQKSLTQLGRTAANIVVSLRFRVVKLRDTQLGMTRAQTTLHLRAMDAEEQAVCLSLQTGGRREGGH